ncbi:MAG TPA: hypothetical protein VII82_09195, partial [Polyangiaceae bacterium]
MLAIERHEHDLRVDHFSRAGADHSWRALKGYCVLGDVVAMPTLAMDLDWKPIVGAPVTLAGFGQSSALAREPPTLRM